MSELDPNIKERIVSLAKSASETMEDVMNVFNAVKFAIKAKQPHLPEVRLNNQTINMIEDHYNKKNRKKSQKMIFIPMGVFSDSKDQNKTLRESILKEWVEPHKHAKMIADGKVFTMKIGEKTVDGKVIDEKIAVSGNHPYKTTDVDGVKVVTEATPWKPGDKIVPRNYEKNVFYGEDSYENWNYGNELDPAWKITLFGLGYYDGTKEVKVVDQESGAVVKKTTAKNLIDDGVHVRLDFLGEYADPNSPKFIVKQPIWFNMTVAKAIDQKYTNELYIQARAKANTGLEIVPSDKLMLLDYETDGQIRKGVISRINERIYTQAKKLELFINTDGFEKEPKDKKKQIEELFKLYQKFTALEFVPIIDLDGVNQYHISHKALRDKETKEILKDGAWDKTDFNSFAICECSFTGTYTPSGKPPKMVITDPSLPQNKSLFCKFPTGFDSKMSEGQCLISLMTSRGNQVYDEESGEYIEDPENAQAMPRITGIRVFTKFEDIDVEKILADL